MVLSSSKGWPCREPASNLSSAGLELRVWLGPGLVPLPDFMVEGISAQTEATPRRTKECSVLVGTQDRLLQEPQVVGVERCRSAPPPQQAS